jgi:hypothetical protein
MSNAISQSRVDAQSNVVLIALSIVTCVAAFFGCLCRLQLLMFRGSATPARTEVSAAKFGPAGIRIRSGAESYLATLKAKLAITEAQTEAWAAFAESLWANRRRMGTVDQPYGILQDRLAALASMRHAAAPLFAVLDAAQQRRAKELLPLCCLPQAAALV